MADWTSIYDKPGWTFGKLVDGQEPDRYLDGNSDQRRRLLDLVVVRMGHYKGFSVGFESLRKLLALLMQAVPKKLQ